MIFEADGTRYDTSEMEAYETSDMARYLASQPVDDACILTIYQTRDRKLVFVLTMSSARGIHIHRAGADETRRLAATYQIPALLDALSPNGSP